MKEAPIPENDVERVAALRSMGILDTEEEERFDRITRIATHLFSVPISTVTLVDSNREWFKSCQGLDEKEGDRAISFCGHALLVEQILIIPDAREDERFADNPMVTGEPFIRFYAGVPLRATDGKRIGTFCIKHHEPKQLTEEQQVDLQALAAWAERELNTHELTSAIEELEKMNELMVDREIKMTELKEQLKACEPYLKGLKDKGQ